MENTKNVTVSEFCSMVKMFGHMSLDPIGNTLYELSIKIGVPVPGWGGKFDHDDIETNVRKWIIEHNFELNKPTGNMRIHDVYSLTNWKKGETIEQIGHYRESDDEILPHDVSSITISLPGREYDGLYGKTRLVKHHVKLDQEYEFFEDPKEVTIMVFMKKPNNL
jgi:hypothetical protein